MKEETEQSQSSGKALDMLHGPLLKKIIFFALPIAASSILQQLFNSADVAVAGVLQRVEPWRQLAAIRFWSACLSICLWVFLWEPM